MKLLTQKRRTLYPKETDKRNNNPNRDKNTLESLSFMELNNLQEDFRNEISYNDIRQKYNLKSYVNLDKDLLHKTQKLKDEMLLDSFKLQREDVAVLTNYYNAYSYGLVFWDKERAIDSVEDLLDYLEYNHTDFESEVKRIKTKEN